MALHFCTHELLVRLLKIDHEAEYTQSHTLTITYHLLVFIIVACEVPQVCDL